MLYCEKCGVRVKGRPDFCPLCQGNLTGVPDGGDIYPAVKPKPSGFKLAVKIAAFVTIAAILVCIAVNFSQTGSLLGWWLYALAGAASVWAAFGIAMFFHGNLSKSIVITMFISCVIAFFWDLSTGYKGWSLDIVLPSACCLAMLATAVLARIMKLRIEQYIYYIVIDIIIGIVSLILLLCGVIRFIYPSVACVAASILSLAGLLIFYYRALKAEIILRTHL